MCDRAQLDNPVLLGTYRDSTAAHGSPRPRPSATDLPGHLEVLPHRARAETVDHMSTDYESHDRKLQLPLSGRDTAAHSLIYDPACLTAVDRFRPPCEWRHHHRRPARVRKLCCSSRETSHVPQADKDTPPHNPGRNISPAIRQARCDTSRYSLLESIWGPLSERVLLIEASTPRPGTMPPAGWSALDSSAPCGWTGVLPVSSISSNRTPTRGTPPTTLVDVK